MTRHDKTVMNRIKKKLSTLSPGENTGVHDISVNAAPCSCQLISYISRQVTYGFYETTIDQKPVEFVEFDVILSVD